MIENGTLLQERYLIEKQIGAGGMGAVYLAIDQRFGSYVAIKETFYKDKELGDAFEREAHLLNSLHHPALPHVSDYFTENNGYFLVMQFIEGEDLSEILKREGAFPVTDVLRWMDSLLDALDYLHSQESPIVHRDIKPNNLKITTRGDIILLDFGLAKLNSEDTTGVKSVFGYSRKYSPLEQIQGTGTDARSDIFALAATSYHLLTGKPPIDVLARAAEIIVGNPDPLQLADEFNNEVPIGVANVLNSALALNSAGRFVSAKAMRQALKYAVNADSTENTEELPQQVLAAVAASNEVIISPETKNFPALESFAVETAQSSPQIIENDESEAVVIPISNAQTPLPAPAPPQVTSVGDMATKISPRINKSRFPLAAFATLVICVGLAAGYFINKANSSNESNETPVVQTSLESNSNTGQSAIALDLPTPEVADTLKLENVGQAKTKPISIEKTVEKKEIIDEPVDQGETTEKSKPAPAPAKTPRRSQTQRNDETRSREVEPQPVLDIESIFTGRPSGERSDKQRRQEERRRQQEQMSDEKREEMRRQRRPERRQRQNSNIPF
ncbi:MAG: serine/threonine protein kinase [Acidobacteria bacterium]|nr:serine/threonine protein kinase [Acidobacteriota bacterium]